VPICSANAVGVAPLKVAVTVVPVDGGMLFPPPQPPVVSTLATKSAQTAVFVISKSTGRVPS